jgi:predicted TIM-barrel fold metal-dependent hydrolase
MVASVALEDPQVDVLLSTMVAAHPTLRGIRQIVNFEPSWPRNGALGNLLLNDRWRQGYALLAKHRLSFDLQVVLIAFICD